MSLPMIIHTRPRIIILGGGFAGAYCAQALQKTLKKRNADVLLIDPNNYFVFTPLLVEAGIGNIEPRHAVVPIRQFLSRRTRFRMGQATGIDPENQRVFYRMVGEQDNRVAEYDHLVIATGSVTSFPPVPGLHEYGFQMKSMADSVALRDRAIQLLEVANVAHDDARKRALLHFVVVGANYSGVEVAGEFNEFLRSGCRHYRNINPRDCRVTVVEKLPHILPALPRSLADYAEQKLREMGVDIRTSESVSKVEKDHVTLASGEVLGAHTVVWCAGIAQNPLANKLPLEKDERGFIQTEPDLRVRGHDNIWAIGDTAINPKPGGGSYPPTAQSATRLGKHLAKNLARVLTGEEPRPATFSELGSLTSIGCRTAVANVLGVKVSGFPAWWLWRTVYLMKMPKLGRKVRVALDWTIELFFRRDHVQLGLRAKDFEVPRTAERDKHLELEAG